MPVSGIDLLQTSLQHFSLAEALKMAPVYRKRVDSLVLF